MATRRDRTFFTCPRWKEIPAATRSDDGLTIDVDLSPRTAAAIEEGRPLARSTLPRVLFAVRCASGSLFDVDELIVNRRSGHGDA